MSDPLVEEANRLRRDFADGRLFPISVIASLVSLVERAVRERDAAYAAGWDSNVKASKEILARAEKAEAELAEARKDLDDNEVLRLVLMRDHPVARAERRLAEDVAKMPKEPEKNS